MHRRSWRVAMKIEIDEVERDLRFTLATGSKSRPVRSRPERLGSQTERDEVERSDVELPRCGGVVWAKLGQRRDQVSDLAVRVRLDALKGNREIRAECHRAPCCQRCWAMALSNDGLLVDNFLWSMVRRPWWHRRLLTMVLLTIPSQ